MKIHIATILNTVGESDSYSIEEKLTERLSDDCKIDCTIAIDVTLSNVEAFILATGTITAQISCICANCQKEFPKTVEFKFEEKFVEESLSSTIVHTELLDDDYELSEEDVFYTYSSNFEIDIFDFARELLILNLPIAPKCDINCTVKNQDSKKTIDPRLAVLEKLKTEDEDGSTKEKDN